MQEFTWFFARVNGSYLVDQTAFISYCLGLAGSNEFLANPTGGANPEPDSFLLIIYYDENPAAVQLLLEIAVWRYYGNFPVWFNIVDNQSFSQNYPLIRVFLVDSF